MCGVRGRCEGEEREREEGKEGKTQRGIVKGREGVEEEREVCIRREGRKG